MCVEAETNLHNVANTTVVCQSTKLLVRLLSAPYDMPMAFKQIKYLAPQVFTRDKYRYSKALKKYIVSFVLFNRTSNNNLCHTGTFFSE